MTDLELLKQAAKAVGIHVKQGRQIAINGRIWNPLEDDGDALRLAVKLGLRVMTPDGELSAVVDTYPPKIRCEESVLEHNGDVYIATRRAIVRAAAEIGKQ